MADRIKVNFEGVSTAGTGLVNAASKIENLLVEMDRQLAPLKSDWEGSAQEAYTAAQLQWNQAIGEMKTFLAGIGTTTTASSDTYQGTEDYVKKMYG